MIEIFTEIINDKECIVLELIKSKARDFEKLTKENLTDLRNTLHNELLFVERKLRNRGWE